MSIGSAYKHHKFEGDYDTLVIGSGMGGLCTAAVLAKALGERVLVLERHYTAGGFTHAFHRPGFEWDVGVHYIGQVGEPGQYMRRLFDYLSDGALKWADMGEVYDSIEIAGRRYDFVKGKEAFRARLKEYFPTEARAIDRYLKLIARATAAIPAFYIEKMIPAAAQRLVGGLLRWPTLRFARRTTAQVLEELTDNVELRAVLSAQWGDYGLPPARGSFLMHAVVVAHYLDGAAYPVGGASRIAETITQVIEAHRGAVLIRAEVSEILVREGRAVGVRMADGRELHARKVISDAGAAVTIGRLLPESLRCGLKLSNVAQEIGPSCAHLSLYVGLDRSASELGLTKSNRWLYPSADYDKSLAAFEANPEAPLPVVYLSFPSAKDPSFEERYPGRATIEVITFASYDWFARWQDSQWGRRGDDYAAFKQRLQQRMQRALEEACPSVVGHISHVELSTPLSTRHFAGHPQGEIYGLAHTPARFEARALQPRTPIAGLYLTGSDVSTAGVGGALMGGVLAASVASKRNLMSVVVR